MKNTPSICLPTPCLMLLTDRTRLTPNWALAQALAPAITGGCNLVVLRETDLPPTPRTTVARFALDGVKGRVPFITAGDPSFAVAQSASGVLLEGGEWSPVAITEARRLLGVERLLGVSIQSVEEAHQAEEEGADYALIEYDWSNPEGVLDHFRSLRTKVERLPVIVGTDMTPEQARACRAAGAAGVAICAPGMSAYDRTAACRTYTEALQEDETDGKK